MGRAKNLYPVIETNFKLIRQLLEFSADSIYGNSKPISYNILTLKLDKYQEESLNKLNLEKAKETSTEISG